MHYVYILKIKNRVKLLYYIGYTRDLKRRIFEHQKDNEIELIYYEAYQSEKIAKTRERKLKQYSGAWRSLKQRLNPALCKRAGGNHWLELVRNWIIEANKVKNFVLSDNFSEMKTPPFL